MSENEREALIPVEGNSNTLVIAAQEKKNDEIKNKRDKIADYIIKICVRSILRCSVVHSFILSAQKTDTPRISLNMSRGVAARGGRGRGGFGGGGQLFTSLN